MEWDTASYLPKTRVQDVFTDGVEHSQQRSARHAGRARGVRGADGSVGRGLRSQGNTVMHGVSVRARQWRKRGRAIGGDAEDASGASVAESIVRYTAVGERFGGSVRAGVEEVGERDRGRCLVMIEDIGRFMDHTEYTHCVCMYGMAWRKNQSIISDTLFRGSIDICSEMERPVPGYLRRTLLCMYSVTQDLSSVTCITPLTGLEPATRGAHCRVFD